MNVGEMMVVGEKTEVLGKKRFQCHFVDHKFQMDYSGAEPGPFARRGRRQHGWAMAQTRENV